MRLDYDSNCSSQDKELYIRYLEDDLKAYQEYVNKLLKKIHQDFLEQQAQ